MAAATDIEASYHCSIYKMGDIMFVPHHTKKGVFVAPGGVEHTQQELRRLRARPIRKHLWARAWAQRAKLQDVI